MGNKQFT